MEYGWVLYTLDFKHTQKKKSVGVRSGNLAGHSMFLMQPVLCPGHVSSNHKHVAVATCIRACHLAWAIHAAGNQEEVCQDRLQNSGEHFHVCVCSNALKKYLVPKSYCYEWDTTP
jgi:hypothetical protein